MHVESDPDEIMRKLYPSDYENWFLTTRFDLCRVCLIAGRTIRTPMKLHFDPDADGDIPDMPCCSLACAQKTGQELHLRQEPKNALAAVLSTGPLLSSGESPVSDHPFAEATDEKTPAADADPAPPVAVLCPPGGDSAGEPHPGVSFDFF